MPDTPPRAARPSAALALVFGLGLLSGLASAIPAAALAAPPARRNDLAPAFDVEAETPHRVAVSFDTAPARDFLALITGAPDAPGTLKRLKAYRSVSLALEKEGLSADDFFGRVVGYVAGSPDPLVQSFARQSERYRTILETLRESGPALAAIGARRVASLLPESPPIAVRLIIVPFFSTAGFREVLAVPDGDALYLVVDLPKLGGDATAPPPEVMTSLLRATMAETWRSIFATSFEKPPIWPGDSHGDFDTLLARTVSEGPPTLFLFPDEFSPIGSLLEEPIERSFTYWNRIVEMILDPKRKEEDKRTVIAQSTSGDFWRRHSSIVGAAMTDALLRRVGRSAYLAALAQGPRAVASLYVKETKGSKVAQLGSQAKKALDRPPAPTPTAAAPTPAPVPTLAR